MKKISWLLGILFVGIAAQAQIRLNQLGFLPGTSKQAVVLASLGSATFDIIDGGDNIVFTGNLGSAATWSYSGESVRIADFSDLREPGIYYVRVGSVKSNSFEIGYSVYEDVFKASLKYFYFNRASIDLEPEYAGIYARKGGHPDTLIYRYPGSMRVNPSPKGWYDAGDYNKYVVNSGISTYTLMSLYEHFPEYIQTVNLTIPESDNSTPDLLDEVFWNLSWMLTMQDPADGGVYHKLSNEKFDDFIMPEEAIEPRYIVQKSAVATHHFVATMAVASRVFKNFQEDYPKYDSIFLAAAVKAYNSLYFSYNEDFSNPGNMQTGVYGYSEGAKGWAEIEMYLSSGGELGNQEFGVDSFHYPLWYKVHGLPYISLAANIDKLNAIDKSKIRDAFIRTANSFFSFYNSSAYRVMMGSNSDDFNWGSNGNAANQSYIMLIAFKLTGDLKYLEGALGNIDYILGKNPLGYSYVTGFGHTYPLKPHHRISEADGIDEPIPGALVGGPHNAFAICEPLLGNKPATGYVDDVCNYMVNEVAINWNAPFAFVAGAVNALYNSFPVLTSHPQNISFQSSGRYVMSLAVLNTDEEYIVDWYKNGILYASNGGFELIFQDPRQKDEGIYYAVISNQYGSAITRKAYFTAVRSESEFVNPHVVPGIIEAEDYHSFRPKMADGNLGGMYRDGEADIYVTDDISGMFYTQFVLGDIATYTIQVYKSGQYKTRVRAKMAGSGGTFSLALKGPGIYNFDYYMVNPYEFNQWTTMEGTQTWNLSPGNYTLEISGGSALNYIELYGLWEDCAGVIGGLHEQDECGACLLPDDPDFDNCLITSIPEAKESNVRIYPVPASDILYVDKNGGERFEIWNSMGQKVLHNTLNADHRIDISGLSSGSYRIRLIGRDQVEVFPFIKK